MTELPITRTFLTHLGAAAAGGLIIFLLVARDTQPDPSGNRSLREVTDRPGNSRLLSRKSFRATGSSASVGSSGKEQGNEFAEVEEAEKFLQQAGLHHPSRSELENYLSSRNHSAEACLAAGLILQDTELLKEALEREPSNPHALFTLASRGDFPSSQRLAWAAQLHELQPENALASYLIAKLNWEAGEIDSALESLDRAHQQTGFESFTSESMMAVTDALRATGSSPGGAALYSSLTSEVPHLSELLSLSRNLQEYWQKAPPGEAAILREQNAALGARLTQGGESEFIISELVGLAIQNTAYEDLPQDAPLPRDGIDSQQLEQSIEQRRSEIREFYRPGPIELLRASPDMIEGYAMRVHALGELEALSWLRSHAQPPGE